MSFLVSTSLRALHGPRRVPQNAIGAHGSFKNFNTIEDFKNADKTALFNHTADEIWKSIVEDRSTAQLTRFLLLTFADLKKYKYFYWFAFPAFATKPAWEIDGEWQSADETLGKDTVCWCSQSPYAYLISWTPVCAACRHPCAAPCLPASVLPRPHRGGKDRNSARRRVHQLLRERPSCGPHRRVCRPLCTP